MHWIWVQGLWDDSLAPFCGEVMMPGRESRESGEAMRRVNGGEDCLGNPRRLQVRGKASSGGLRSNSNPFNLLQAPGGGAPRLVFVGRSRCLWDSGAPGLGSRLGFRLVLCGLCWSSQIISGCDGHWGQTLSWRKTPAPRIPTSFSPWGLFIRLQKMQSTSVI